jgi:hypothetical protein
MKKTLFTHAHRKLVHVLTQARHDRRLTQEQAAKRVGPALYRVPIAKRIGILVQGQRAPGYRRPKPHDFGLPVAG